MTPKLISLEIKKFRKFRKKNFFFRKGLIKFSCGIQLAFILKQSRKPYNYTLEGNLVIILESKIKIIFLTLIKEHIKIISRDRTGVLESLKKNPSKWQNF